MTVKKPLAALLLASSLASVSCAAKSPKPEATSVEEAVAAAETARQKAASVGGESLASILVGPCPHGKRFRTAPASVTFSMYVRQRP